MQRGIVGFPRRVLAPYELPASAGLADTDQVLVVQSQEERLSPVSSVRGVSVLDEGSALTTTAAALDFRGSGVTVSGAGPTKTVTVAGGAVSNGLPDVEIDVREYGAVCDDSTDDTAAIQAAIDSVGNELNFRALALYLPGVSVISDTLISRGRSLYLRGFGLGVRGVGAPGWGSALRWNGPANWPMLEISMAHNIRIEQMAFWGNASNRPSACISILGLSTLADPGVPTLSTSTSGGSLAAGNYRYRVAVRQGRRSTTLAGPSGTIATTGSASTVTVTIPRVAGATHYEIYRSAVNGSAGSELLLTRIYEPHYGPGLSVVFVDTGSLSPSGALPSLNNTNVTPQQQNQGGIIKNVMMGRFANYDGASGMMAEHGLICEGADLNSDHLKILEAKVTGCRHAFRTTGVQQVLHDLDGTWIGDCETGLHLRSLVQFRNLYVANASTAVIYMNDPSETSVPEVVGEGLSSEFCSRLLYARSAGYVDIRGGYFQAGPSLNADNRAVDWLTNYYHPSLKLTSYEFRDGGSGGLARMKLRMGATASGSPTHKQMRLEDVRGIAATHIESAPVATEDILLSGRAFDSSDNTWKAFTHLLTNGSPTPSFA